MKKKIALREGREEDSDSIHFCETEIFGCVGRQCCVDENPVFDLLNHEVFQILLGMAQEIKMKKCLLCRNNLIIPPTSCVYFTGVSLIDSSVFSPLLHSTLQDLRGSFIIIACVLVKKPQMESFSGQI